MRRGVYFIANDRVYDLAVAFLNSFREFNPDISLCLVPYNEDVVKILLLKELYDFEIFFDISLLKQCDEISVKFHGQINGSYRKLALWEGIYDEFIYIDVDTIVVDNIDFSFSFLDAYPCVTSHSNMREIIRFVWKRSIFDTDYLERRQVEFAANTGFIASRKGFLSMEWMLSHLNDALMLKDHMELFCQEQPLLNYFIVTSGKPYTSLYVLSLPEKDSRIPLEHWAGMTGGSVKNGKLYFSNNKKIFLIHWAGLWQPRGVDLLIFRFRRMLGVVDKDANPGLYLFMPYKKLWRYYRNRTFKRA